MAATKAPTNVEEILRCRRAHVYLDDICAGDLEQIATDDYLFSYRKDYIDNKHPPLSWSLPLHKRNFSSETLHPFFDNLLFEGSQLRLAEKMYGLKRQSQSDRFKLLLISAQDTIGGIKIIPVDARGTELFPSQLQALPTEWQPVDLVPAYKGKRCAICLEAGNTHAACYKKLWGQKKHIALQTDPSDPKEVFRHIVPGVSISGAQLKTVLQLSKNGLLQPKLPFTHIIKPDGDFPEMPANEHLTMSIARQTGFPVPACGLYEVKGIGLIFVIKRFDLVQGKRRFYMEDFAQILALMEHEKTDATFEDLAKALKVVASSPILESRELFRRMLFSFCFGNGDMHLKNWSMAYDIDASVRRLSQVYDWLNVRASMPQEQVEMILPLNAKRNNLERGDFELFAQKIGLNPGLISKAFADVSQWQEIAHTLTPHSALSSNRQKSYLKIIDERCTRLKQ